MTLVIRTIVKDKKIQQPAQQKKEEIHQHKHQAESDHILLRILQVLHADVLLHHLLVQPRHSNGNEHAPDDLLQKKALAVHIEIEYTRKTLLIQCLHRTPKGQVHMTQDIEDAHYQP